MLKIDNFSTKLRRILTFLILAILTITITGCKSKVVDTLPYDDNYLTVGNYSVTKGDVWNELKWNAADLFDTKAQEAVLDKYLTDIKTVMSDSKNEKYDNYKTRLQNYLVEDVYDLTFSLESHDEEISDLKEDNKNTSINKYADEIYKNYPVSITTEEIVNALKADDYDKLSPLYEIYYLNYAKELLAIDKLNEEIEQKNKEAQEDDDEETVGYFTKSSIVTKYKDEYLHQGYVDVIMIKFASETEANETLRAFGLIVKGGNQLCYLTDTPANFNEYKTYYDEFDFDEEDESSYIPLDSYYGSSIILQLYIAMYNYIYTYRTALQNIDVNMQNIIDQRQTTASLIDFYENLKISNAEEEDARIKVIMDAVNTDETPNEYVRYTAEELNDMDSSLYDYIYETLRTPAETVVDGDEQADKINRYTTAPKSINSTYYMVYKVDYEKDVADDEVYSEDYDTDELYEKLVNNENLYNKIIQDLTDEALTSTYIDEKLNAELENVKVKIFDKNIEIAYSVDHEDYNKTLTKAPDTNTIATFEYNDTKIAYELTNEEGKGLWDILEYRNGTSTASNLISTKMIKDSDEYKNISQEDIDSYYSSIEYVLASFANDLLASNGYPASIGKYNFLMLYYHTADVDQIVNDVFKVSKASSQILTDYMSDETIDFFYNYVEKSYTNFFSVTATDLKVYLDIDEDGEADEIDWATKTVEFDGTPNVSLKDVVKQLIEVIYEKLAATSGDHATALTNLVTTYNSTSRFNPKEGGQFDEPDYDPIGSEWDFAKFKRLGLVIATEDMTVTNSSTDYDVAIMNKLRDVYFDNGLATKEYNEVILEDPATTDLIEANNCLNYFLITGYEKPASAKYEEYKDTDGIYKDLIYSFNQETYRVENVYNENDMLTKRQIVAYMLEYLNTSTSNLIPTDISSSLTSFFSPVLTRFQDTATQVEIIYNYVSSGDNNAYVFADSNNNERFATLREINIKSADNYKVYDNETDEQHYNNFYGWWVDLNKLSEGGNQ